MKCLVVKRAFFAELGNFSTDIVSAAFEVLCAKSDEVTDERHVVFLEASGGSGGRTYADTAGNEGTLGIVGNGVLVDGDINFVKALFEFLAGDVHGTEVNEEEVVVRTAGNEVEAFCEKSLFKRFRVLYDLFLISLEFGLESFAEANRLCGDGVHERTALCAGEDCLVDLLCEFFSAEDHTAARTAEGLVSGGGNDVSVGNGVGVKTCSNETCNVSHVNHEVCANFLCDCAHLFEIDCAGVSGSACNDELGLAFKSNLTECFVVDLAVSGIYAVGNEVVVAAGDVNGRTVGQVTAVSEVHTENGVAGLKECEVNGSVCLCATVGLNVCVFCAEELASAFASDVFNDVYAFATAVVTLGGPMYLFTVVKPFSTT